MSANLLQLPVVTEPNQDTSMIEKATQFEILDAGTFAEASKMIQGLKAGIKEIEAHYKPIKQAFDKGKKDVMDREKADIAPWQDACTVLTLKANDYNREQQRIAQERAAEERRKAEEEAAAERARLMAEEKARREAEAERLAAEGDIEQAVATIEEPIIVPVVSVAYVAPAVKVAPPAQGVSSKKELKIISIDVKELCAAIGAGAVPVGVIDVKEAQIKSLIRAGMVVPGVHSEMVDVLAFRA